ncbi:MAG: hypothetical protein M0R03_03585 [Novosphingobium sp.]|nr:hypothetical protein [Novosphingobium sp.]
MKDTKKIPAARFLYDTGLLFEINRRILHPFGLAMEIKYDDQEGALSDADAIMTMSQELWDYRDDPEGMIYGDESLKNGGNKFKKFLDAFGKEKLQQRMELLGFTIQPIGESQQNEKVEKERPKEVKSSAIIPTADVSDEDIKKIMEKNAAKRTTESISNKVIKALEGAALTPMDDGETELKIKRESQIDATTLKKIKRYEGKEHPTLGNPDKKCVSTLDNTEYAAIKGGTGIVFCLDCGRTLSDSDLN